VELHGLEVMLYLSKRTKEVRRNELKESTPYRSNLF
jgi:hypothetical protein